MSKGYARRYLSSLVIAVFVFVVAAGLASLGLHVPRIGGAHAHWWSDPTVWLLVLAATIVVGLIQRRRMRRRATPDRS